MRGWDMRALEVLAAVALVAATGIPVRASAQSAPDEGDENDDASAGIVLDNAAFVARLAQSEALVRNSQPTVQVGGYVDLGFFVPQGNGSGYIEDFGHAYFPQYDPVLYPLTGFGWVFLGDILAPAVNSRGEPADLGDPAGVDRQDLIDSNGAPSFIVNEVNLTLNGALASTVLGTASVNFMPRTGSDFRLGDAFDVDLAQLEWLVGAERRTSIFIGKFNSVIGIEYQTRKANQKFGITQDYWLATGSKEVELFKGRDKGRFQDTKNEADAFIFKVQQLRNVAVTPPYFHDGSVTDLRDAVRIMAKLQLGRDIGDGDIADILAFLESLTGEVPEQFASVPNLPAAPYRPQQP